MNIHFHHIFYYSMFFFQYCNHINLIMGLNYLIRFSCTCCRFLCLLSFSSISRYNIVDIYGMCRSGLNLSLGLILLCKILVSLGLLAMVSYATLLLIVPFFELSIKILSKLTSLQHSINYTSSHTQK